MKRNLTLRYSIYQFLFFSITAGTGGFAATFLLEKGFSSSTIGLILAATSITSCIAQPLFGTLIDRTKRFVLPKLLGLMVITAMVSFGLLRIIPSDNILFSLLYILGGLVLAIMPSLSNSLCAYYANRKVFIDFGIGAGVGSLAYSVASLGIGYLIAWQGADSMILLALVLLVCLLITVSTYPKAEATDVNEIKEQDHHRETSLTGFIRKYPAFLTVLGGIMLLAMCHAMEENYLINLFESMGGGSQNVGTTMFLACASAFPFLIKFERIQEKLGAQKLIRLAGLFYMIKAMCLALSTSVIHVYLASLLQFCTYGFLFPSLYYFVRGTIPAQDMGKGQTIAMTIYTLGLAFGSYAGGQLIHTGGIKSMLFITSIIALTGTVIVNLTMQRVRYHD